MFLLHCWGLPGSGWVCKIRLCTCNMQNTYYNEVMANKTHTHPQFIAWLKSSIEQSGVSPTRWAIDHGIQQSQMSRILMGKMPPSPKFLAVVGWEVCYRKAE